MTRALVDTNVLVSGFKEHETSSSPPAVIVRSWRRGEFILLTSDHVLSEFRRATAKSYFLKRTTPAFINSIINLIEKRAEIVEVIPPVPQVATHWQDDLVLAAAKVGAADYLVTGDNELLALGAYGITSIVSVDDFVAVLDASNAED